MTVIIFVKFIQPFYFWKTGGFRESHFNDKNNSRKFFAMRLQDGDWRKTLGQSVS